jgi:hypothetical protein
MTAREGTSRQLPDDPRVATLILRRAGYGKRMQEHSALLHLVRALAALDGVEVVAAEQGALVGRRGTGPVIGWPEIAELLRDDDPFDRAPRLRLAVLVELYRRVAALGEAAAEELARAARPLALPAGHPLRPGAGWVREAVPGGLLDLGVGVAGFLPDQDDVLPLQPSVALAAGFDVAAAWSRVRALGDCRGEIAVSRLLRPGLPLASLPALPVLWGTGGCDALTLLALPGVRARLDGPAAVPARDRAWLGTRAADEAYLQAVWMLTPPARRGIPEPLAVGPEGVVPLRPRQLSGRSPIGS